MNEMDKVTRFYHTFNKEQREKAKTVLFVIGIAFTLFLSIQLWPEDPLIQQIPVNNKQTFLSSTSYLHSLTPANNMVKPKLCMLDSIETSIFSMQNNTLKNSNQLS